MDARTVTASHAAAVAEATRLQQLYSDLMGRYEALLRDCHPAYSAGGPMPPVSRAFHDVAAERRRQIVEENHTAANDDTLVNGELARAGAAYALAGGLDDHQRARLFPSTVGCTLRDIWPPDWPRAWFQPTTRRRDLVRAAALAIAEIERQDRASTRTADQLSTE